MPDESRRSVTIVTSENLAEFTASKLDALSKSEAALAEPEKAVEQVVEAKEVKEPVVEAQKEPSKEPAKEEHEPDKKNPKLEKRFSEMTEARKAVEAERDRERVRAEAAERKAAELEAKLAPPKQEELGPEPQAETYTDAKDYAKALATWTVDKAMLERDKKEADARSNAERERVAQTWAQRMETAKKEIPDYSDKIAAATVQVSDQVRDAILESEVGPRILYHFAEHPEDAERIGKLSVNAALRALGKIEAKVEEAVQAEAKTKAEVKEPQKEPEIPAKKTEAEIKTEPKVEISKAPAPISPLKGANKPVESRVDSTGKYIGTYDQYKKDRAEGKIK